MKSKEPTRPQILRTLLEHLDDAQLSRFFPGHDPVDIRRIAAGTPASATPAAESVGLVTDPVAVSGRCRLFTDGASRGNPGEAGAGAVLLGPDGGELAARAVYLGTCTNNVAEYKALLIGLDEALRLGCADLEIALDSELIVRQIQGRYKVKNEALLVLFQQVRERLARLGKWSVVHVPRAQNARADQLANRGIDQKEHRE